MPLTFPLSTAQFQERLKISIVSFYLDQPKQIDQTASGIQLSASLGDAVWRGSFSLAPTNDRSVAASRAALISVLDRPGSSFLAYDPAKAYPASDPDGSILASLPGGGTPKIAALDNNDARLLSVSNLPANYQLTSGDWIGWQYGASPVRYALHRIVSDVQADALGATTMFEVAPFIAPGATVGAAVTLIKPVVKMMLSPSPDYGTSRPAVSSGAQFSFVQTMR